MAPVAAVGFHVLEGFGTVPSATMLMPASGTGSLMLSCQLISRRLCKGNMFLFFLREWCKKSREAG